MWEQLKDVTDDSGFTFRRVINTGVMNKSAYIGVHAGSSSSYSYFAPLFNPIIETWHGAKVGIKQPHNWEVEEPYSFTEEEEKLILSTRVRVARNLAGYKLGPQLEKEEYINIE